MIDTKEAENAISVYMGAFNSENYWREETLAKLPAMDDDQAKQIVLAMDEMQFVFCKPGDVLVTRFAMDEAHLHYLRRIGFNFALNLRDLAERTCRKEALPKSVFQLLAETDEQEYYRNLIPPQSNLSPFAVIPFTGEVSSAYRMRFQAPSMDIIEKVNSKIYSTQLKERLGVLNSGKIVTGSADLFAYGTEFLKDSPFLIKDAFGVSGKGNLLVNSEAILQRIIAYLSSQEKKGKYAQFVLEPFLDKETDFSCQFSIAKSGEFKLLSLQRLVNSGFAYQGSFTADREFKEMLGQKGYLELMEQTARELYHDGYDGDVCIDSMMLKNGDIVPIVEINARKSMSLLKHHIDQFLEQFSLQGNLSYISVAYQASIPFAELLTKMAQAGLLFDLDGNSGIIPLTANSLFINRDMAKVSDGPKTYQGRLYFSAVAGDTQGILHVTQKMKAFMETNGFKIQN